MSAAPFARNFAAAFAQQDAAQIAGLVAIDGTVLTLTGQWAEGAAAAQTAFESEFAGIFANARLVTGKSHFRQLGADKALLNQRFVVTGAQDESCKELPRFGALLVAVLCEAAGWRALSLTFTALP